MDEYTAEDFKNARFAVNLCGGVQQRSVVSEHGQAGRSMSEGAAWQPIRHMSLNIIGARVQFRRPTVDGHLTLAGPFIVYTLHVDPGLTLGGEPMFETARITDTNGDPFTAYDGDEFQEIHP